MTFVLGNALGVVVIVGFTVIQYAVLPSVFGVLLLLSPVVWLATRITEEFSVRVLGRHRRRWPAGRY